MYWIRRRSRRSALAAAAAALLAVPAGGCITINIYFPASAVEKAADRIIDQVWRPVDPAPAPTPETAR